MELSCVILGSSKFKIRVALVGLNVLPPVTFALDTKQAKIVSSGHSVAIDT